LAKFEDTITCIDRIHERDRRTDRQTQRERERERETPHDSIGRACIASRGGKNYNVLKHSATGSHQPRSDTNASLD